VFGSNLPGVYDLEIGSRGTIDAVKTRENPSVACTVFLIMYEVSARIDTKPFGLTFSLGHISLQSFPP